MVNILKHLFESIKNIEPGKLGYKINWGINLGKTESSNSNHIDFKQKGIDLILIAGATGTGRIIFVRDVFDQLTRNNLTRDLKIQFYDPYRQGFSKYKDFFLQNQKLGIKSPVLYPEQQLKVLSCYAKQSLDILGGKLKPDHGVIFHIGEVSGLMAVDPHATIQHIHDIISGSHIHGWKVILSTNRPSTEVLTQELLSLVNMKVIFKVSSSDQSKMLLGSNMATKFSNFGERIVIVNDEIHHFSDWQGVNTDRWSEV